MSALLVIAEPRLTSADHQWVAQIRGRHDPQHLIVPPHFTLVFPGAEIGVAALTAHAEAAVRGAGPVAFCLRKAVTYDDPRSGQAYVFLVPEEGAKELTALHDKLYRGPLAKARREDIPFVPHVSVGVFRTAPQAVKLAKTLNAGELAIPGVIDSIAIMRYDGHTLTTLKRIPLA